MKKLHDFDEVFDSQKVFRLILQAMANPARIVSIEEFARKFTFGLPVFLATAMTLLDNEVSFYAANNIELANNIITLTLSRQETLINADYVLVTDARDLEEIIAVVKCGTLRDPSLSATLIIMDNGEGTEPIRLHGPGINGSTALQASQTVRRALSARDLQYYEFPQGIDLLFVTEGGQMFAIPRLVFWEVW